MTLTSVLFIFIISLFHTTLLPQFSIYGNTPDIFLLFSIFYSLNFDIKRVTFFNWINGLSKDVFSEGPLGLSSFLFIIVGFIINLYKDIVFKDHFITQFFTSLFAALFYNLAYLFWAAFAFGNINLSVIMQKILYSSLYTAMISSLLFFVFTKFKSGLGLGKRISFGKRY